MNYYPTKEELIRDYFELNLMHQEIAEKYGYKTRQVIYRLFKKYNIKTKSKSELSKQIFSRRCKKPSKNELILLYEKYSISELSKIFKVGRKTVTKWIEEYQIEKTYFKNKINNKLLNEEVKILSLKELSIKYNVDPSELKRRVKDLPKINYSKEDIIRIVNLYDIKLKNFSGLISFNDSNVLSSIMKLTENHFLESSKITERIYRIMNNMEPDEIVRCKKCSLPLKFYTLDSGYGKSCGVCRNCISSLSGTSKPSQELFWLLYHKMNRPKNCNFSELNNEKTIYITEKDKISFKNLNKYRYHIDFIIGNKIIEYNGEYWHKNKSKEISKNKFFRKKGFYILNIMDSEYKKEPDKVIDKCIKFLSK